MSVTENPSAPEILSFRHFRNRSTWLGLTLVLIIYLTLAIALSQVTPFNKGPDEGYHLEYITFIKQHGRLPISYQERAQITRADFPPLYHLLVSLVTFKVSINGPPRLKIFWDSFRYRTMDHQSDQVWTINTEDFQPPYYGRFFVWQMGRWLSIVFGLATIVVVFFTLQNTPLRKIPFASLTGTAFLAFIPQYIFLESALNDDSLLGLLAALYFWALVKTINEPERWWPSVTMGILLGLSITVKYTLIVVPLELMVIYRLIAWNRGLSWSWVFRRIGVVGTLALLCSSWWFGWNLWFLNTVSEHGWLVGLLNPLMAGGSDTTLNRISGFFSGGQIGLTELPDNTQVGSFWGWTRVTFLSFWAVDIGGIIPLFPYAYMAVGLLIITAAFGLWRLWQREASSRQWLVLLMLHIGLFFIFPLLRFGLSRRLGQTAQGRHILIPAAVAIVALLVWGLVTAIPKRLHHWVFPAIIAGLIAWTGAHLYRLNTFASPLLPLRTLPEAAEWLPHPANMQFGDNIILASYDINPDPENGLLYLELAWRPLSHVNENYLLQVELVDTTGRVVSHWQGYNGQGRLPTLSWDPGDSVFDRLSLPIPNLAAGAYTLQLQLLSDSGPLVVDNSLVESQDDSTLFLEKIILEKPTALTLSNRITINGEGLADPVEIRYDVWQTDRSGRTDQYPLYRYPATITILASDSRSDEAKLALQLVDASGQAWPATRSEGGIYTFVIGPRWQSNDYRLEMSLQKDDKMVGQILTEPLLIVENWWERHFEVPEIAIPMEANFANQLEFLGYTLPQNRVKAGDSFPITLYWRAPSHRSPQANFIQFNHLLDSSGQLRGGYDRRPLEYYSTLLWAPGEVVVDGYTVPVEADAPPGEYYLSVGYYLTVGESAVNLPLVVDGERTNMHSVSVGPIEVVQR